MDFFRTTISALFWSSLYVMLLWAGFWSISFSVSLSHWSFLAADCLVVPRSRLRAVPDGVGMGVGVDQWTSDGARRRDEHRGEGSGGSMECRVEPGMSSLLRMWRK